MKEVNKIIGIIIEACCAPIILVSVFIHTLDNILILPKY